VTGVEGEVLQAVEVVGGRSWSPDCLGSDSLLDALRSVAFGAGFCLKAILSSANRSSGMIGGAKPVGSTFFKTARSSFLLPVISFCGVSSRYSVVSLVPDSGVIALG